MGRDFKHGLYIVFTPKGRLKSDQIMIEILDMYRAGRVDICKTIIIKRLPTKSTKRK